MYLLFPKTILTRLKTDLIELFSIMKIKMSRIVSLPLPREKLGIMSNENEQVKNLAFLSIKSILVMQNYSSQRERGMMQTLEKLIYFR